MTGLLGGDVNYLTMAIALAIVLVLIVLTVWLIKLVGQASQRVGRGRNRRLAVIDSVAVDQKRQAIIIRRDGVEHLILTGGPNDLVVESGFEAPSPVQMPRTQRRLPAESGKTDTREGAEPAPEPLTTSRSRFNSSGNGTRKSLRHTGLLRPVDDLEPKLAGGNTDIQGAAPGDSAKSTPVGGPQGAEPDADAGETDYAQEGKPYQ